MANIYWMYDNKMERTSRLQPLQAVLEGGTANVCDFNLETRYKGTCALGSHYLNVYFDGTGIRCDTAVLVTGTRLVGTFRVTWGTTLGGQWSGASCAFHSSGTTVLTWAGTVTYVKIFCLQWRLDVRGDALANEIFLGPRLELSSNPVYPVDERHHKSVAVGETPKGVRHAYHNFDRKSWSLNYEGISDADKASLKTMADYCHGPYKPLWFTLNPSVPAETSFVRLASDRLTFKEIVSGAWEVSIPVEQEL